MTTSLDSYQKSVLNAFLNKDGRLKNIPSQKKKKLVVLEYFVQQLNDNQSYTEREINEFIKTYHEDFCTVRREFIVNGYMDRDAGNYIKRDETLWTKWQELK
ncbi:transcriptional regulator [Fictibacillus phosphorivorans]|uniref:Transcriptional regulator n=1 Tax=Fictibacillus phosphorivorans TaxID=1221500 RepID=A0A160IJH1_9BACL|nr:DUF2087 domain-containing protein [Fictibacillus phosphorivorans]ANC76134.1 transcriptional regulator [Fictibacillus phosphorivorans]